MTISKFRLVKGKHNILLVIGFFCLFSSYDITYYSIFLDYDFRVLSTKYVCEQPLNNRCGNEFLISNKNGDVNNSSVIAFPFNLDELAIGNYIKKSKFSFMYYANGTKFTFGLYQYFWFTCFFSGLLILGLWCYLTCKNQWGRRRIQPRSPRRYR